MGSTKANGLTGPSTRTRRLSKGEVLHLAGEPGGTVHVVRHGVLKFVARNYDGRETILGLALRGDCVGDVAAADGGAHPYDVIAAVESVVVALDEAAAAPLLVTSLARRVRWLADAAHERTAAHAGARLAARLLDLAREGEITLPFAQGDLGRLAGASRETVCKELRRLRAAGAVDYRDRRLRILRPDLLERLRCGRVTLPAGRGEGSSRSADAGARRRSRPTRDT